MANKQALLIGDFFAYAANFSGGVNVDLTERGILDETLVVWTGEMGRMPRVGQSLVGGAGAGRHGRDHWGKVFTTVLAGGGVRGGVIYGSSDRYAGEPASPTSPTELGHDLSLPRR